MSIASFTFSATIVRASSQVIGVQPGSSSFPLFGLVLFIGLVMRRSLLINCRIAFSLLHPAPSFIGWYGSPSTSIAFPFTDVTVTPQPPAQYTHMLGVFRPSSYSSAFSALEPVVGIDLGDSSPNQPNGRMLANAKVELVTAPSFKYSLRLISDDITSPFNHSHYSELNFSLPSDILIFWARKEEWIKERGAKRKHITACW